MPTFELKPAIKAVVACGDTIAKFTKLGVNCETDLHSAFHEMLEHRARQRECKFFPKFTGKL
jgi:hypothetical protein